MFYILYSTLLHISPYTCWNFFWEVWILLCCCYKTIVHWNSPNVKCSICT